MNNILIVAYPVDIFQTADFLLYFEYKVYKMKNCIMKYFPLLLTCFRNLMAEVTRTQMNRLHHRRFGNVCICRKNRRFINLSTYEKEKFFDKINLLN